MIKVLTILVCLLLNLTKVSAKIHSEEVDYKTSMIQYYHSGSKVKVKLKSLPYNTAQVIISPVNNDKKPKLFIIGSKNLIPQNDNSIEFTVELEDLKPGTYNTKSSEIAITLYSYLENNLVVDEKAKFFIRPIICSDDKDEVCATVEVECHKGKQNCENKTENMTFKNRCEMKKQEGIMLHSGACLEAE
jgi:hypothetical protein